MKSSLIRDLAPGPLANRRRRVFLQALPWPLLLSHQAWAGGEVSVGEAEPTGPSTAKPPAVMLARLAPPEMDPRGWLVSEKLDGVRAVWQAGRLRFRGGGEVPAPPSFLARLKSLPPELALDGELWLGRGQFEALSGLVRREAVNEQAWQLVRYRLFDSPGQPLPFAARWQALLSFFPDADSQPDAPVAVLTQRKLDSPLALRHHLQEVLAGGGEGLMLHRADALWRPGRSPDLLKLKPVQDAEATVMGYEPGQGRFAGQVGALRVRDSEGREFRIGSGLSDAWRRQPPPIGTVVTYRWRGTTNSGLPRFPTLWRVRAEGG